MDCYHVLLELMSPLHIGYATLGFVRKTRYYVPGSTIWGALTAVCAREENPPDYERWGRDLKAMFKFSHFFLCTKDNGAFTYYLPQYRTNADSEAMELHYGNLVKNEFERRFITSFAQTSLGPATLTPEDKSLHEFEVISHFIKDKPAQHVYLAGYVFSIAGKKLLEKLNDCQIGGVRKTGMGRVNIFNDIKKTDIGKKAWDHIGIAISSNGFKIVAGAPLPGNLPLTERSTQLCGDIEFSQSLEWDNEKGAGQKRPGPITPFWTPGSFGPELQLEI